MPQFHDRSTRGTTKLPLVTLGQFSIQDVFLFLIQMFALLHSHLHSTAICHWNGDCTGDEIASATLCKLLSAFSLLSAQCIHCVWNTSTQETQNNTLGGFQYLELVIIIQPVASSMLEADRWGCRRNKLLSRCLQQCVIHSSSGIGLCTIKIAQLLAGPDLQQSP